MAYDLCQDIQCLQSILRLLDGSWESKEEIEDVLILDSVEYNNLIQAFPSLIWQWHRLLSFRVDPEILNPKFFVSYLGEDLCDLLFELCHPILRLVLDH